MSKNTLQIVMPMAGLGSRFAKEGFALPKPLIPVDNMPMFRKALTSLDGITVPKSYTFVIRMQHVDEQGLDRLIKEAMPAAQIVVLDEMTRGSAETVLMAQPMIDQSMPMIAMDCDLWFASQSYNDMVQAVVDGEELAGGLLTFKARDPRYSYAKIAPDGYVSETAEKKVISPNAITGAYFFGQAETFTSAATELTKQPLNDAMPEYYISYVYNAILGAGGKVKAATVDKFASFGTPEELKYYEQNGAQDLA